jgi:DNA-binding NarL/FixJ family response regulator
MKVLLVEDHPAMRLGIRAALGLEEDIQVTGETDEAGTALELARSLTPDLVLLDLRLKGKKDGAWLCRKLKALPAPPHVLVYTAYNSREEEHAALLCGADSYVHKGEEPDRLRQTVRETCAGKRVWLLGGEVEEAGTNIQAAADAASLTPKEREVYSLVQRSYSNGRIAEELGGSLSTVKTHVSRVFKKLDASSRDDLLRRGPFY